MAEALDPALPPAVDELAKFVLREACDRNLKLATAESCTGGLLASLLTDIPGMSHAFERGFVTYTDDAKHEMLAVPREVLAREGAVSERSARAMAEGAVARSKADIAASVTGYTEGPPDNPSLAGVVHFAVARRNRPTVHRREHFGDVGRARVRIRALETALGMMRDQMIQAPDASAA
ncbi:MAG: cinA [Phenylobacterium sp.]|jgi:nicotinamide-nucleotide amidase|nr:cinA [Phenylobacterium sp.]